MPLLLHRQPGKLPGMCPRSQRARAGSGERAWVASRFRNSAHLLRTLAAVSEPLRRSQTCPHHISYIPARSREHELRMLARAPALLCHLDLQRRHFA